MEDYSTTAVVSFDGSERTESDMLDYDFNDIVQTLQDEMDVEPEDTDKGKQLLEANTSFVSLQWDSSAPSSRFPDCFLDFDVTEDFFVNHSPEPTEVSDDETDSPSLEHRFEETARRLAESMQKSRQTRFSLTIESPTFEKYPRRTSIDDVVTSVEQSSHQILTTFRGSPTPSS